MLIEKITFKDYKDLEKIGQKSLPIYYNIEEICYLNIHDDNSLMFKASIDKKIIGFLFCKFDKNINNIHINSIAIDEDFRENGYGTELINYIKKYNQNITLNVMQTNLIAINFYKKNGFKVKELRENYYENLENNNAYLLHYNQT